MSWRRFCKMMIIAAGIGFATPSLCADRNDGLRGHKQTAQCMVSVLGELPEVTQPRLVVTNGPEQQVLLTYDYRSHVDGHISYQKVDITEIITHPESFHVFDLTP